MARREIRIPAAEMAELSGDWFVALALALRARGVERLPTDEGGWSVTADPATGDAVFVDDKG